MILVARGYRNKTININLKSVEDKELDVILEKEPSKVELFFETPNIELNREFTTLKFILKNSGFKEREIILNLSGSKG